MTAVGAMAVPSRNAAQSRRRSARYLSRPAGEVTDRLGRHGQAYVYDDTAHSARRMVILDPATGAVLGLEDTVTKGDPEYGVKAGDVMEYSAWMR